MSNSHPDEWYSSNRWQAERHRLLGAVYMGVVILCVGLSPACLVMFFLASHSSGRGGGFILNSLGVALLVGLAVAAALAGYLARHHGQAEYIAWDHGRHPSADIARDGGGSDSDPFRSWQKPRGPAPPPAGR